ncbi:hypothetical protein [Streptomyces fulvorobeus]|uniref:Uncharacterized protein n=1 Tax=Streptomyces fulvorobeus TaxID=284028 RepID=A0A7J0C2Z4_9ACTN|nr:hypothetical protein [Streptomyces fulvorobeus]NYE40482.1 hypothetical protein [Streptomyces fulvorobeus]GFM96768.1 hypothetical protein Sfulv_15790 [Streptomyces fulvorobeus]
MSVRVARLAAWVVLPVELVLVVCLVAGVRIPAAVLLGAELLVLAALALEGWALRRLYAAGRRTGLGRREALRAGVRALVPVPVRRLLVHETRALYSLALWVLRRRHAVPDGALAVPYTEPQTALMYGLVLVSVIETVALAVVIPWPVVHAVLLVVDVYGVILVLALHAACVTRPHVIGADGSLRVRYGGLFDLAVPATAVASARVDRRFPEGGLIRLSPDGVLDLAVGSQTTVTVELTAPLGFVRPLGKPGLARTVRFHADDPRAAVAALTRARTAPSPNPAPPA